MNQIAMMGLPGGSEVVVILFIILLLFGGKKLPELSRSLGKSLGEFKKGKAELERELREVESSARAAVEVDEAETKAGNGPAATDR